MAEPTLGAHPQDRAAVDLHDNVHVIRALLPRPLEIVEKEIQLPLNVLKRHTAVTRAAKCERARQLAQARIIPARKRGHRRRCTLRGEVPAHQSMLSSLKSLKRILYFLWQRSCFRNISDPEVALQ